MSKELTNDVHRTRKKLEVLQQDGSGQMINDIRQIIQESVHNDGVVPSAVDIVTALKKKYTEVLNKYKPPKQAKMNFNEKVN